MGRYISIDNAIKIATKAMECGSYKKCLDVANALYEAPDTEVLEVVRCKDCIHRNPVGEKCLKDNIWHGLTGFCNFGKRKTDES